MVPTRKLFVFLKSPESGSTDQIYAEVRSLLSSDNQIFNKASGLSFCPIGPAPEGLPPRPDDTGDTKPAYDAVIIASFDDTDDANEAFKEAAKADWLAEPAVIETYLVSPAPVIERLPEEVVPAIKYLALNIFHDDLPDSAAQRSWAQHAKLAGIVHTGAGRYFRNWVEARAPEDLPVRGIVEIDFATVPDLTERYFGIPYGMDRIIQDVGHFLQKGIRLYMPEERLR